MVRFLAISTLMLGQVAAFAPQAKVHSVSLSSNSKTVLHSSPVPKEETEMDETSTSTPTPSEEDDAPVYFSILSEENPKPASAGDFLPNAGNSDSSFSFSASSYPTVNGWAPKPDYALWGLPGAIAPLGYFDPIGFARQGLPLNDAKRLREAEVQHGRVAMLATVGYFFQEALAGTKGGGPFHIVGTPANDQLQLIPLPAFALLTVFIGSLELYRAKVGWVEPKFEIGSNTLWTLRDTYYPGDIGFDPLGLKPMENYAFQRMQTKELSNGRLAMIGWAGMCAQELVNHRTIGETLNFYQTVFSGGNPYESYY